MFRLACNGCCLLGISGRHGINGQYMATFSSAKVPTSVITMTTTTTTVNSIRSVFSPAVVQNVSPSTSIGQLGNVIQDEAVAIALRVPPSMMNKLKTPREVVFTKMDLARALYAPLIQSVNDRIDFRYLEKQVAQRYTNESESKDNTDSSSPSSSSSLPSERLQPVKGALRKFTETKWPDMLTLLTFYEEVMYPIRMKHKEFVSHQLTSFHIKDVLKRGLTAFKQDFIDQQKEELVEVQAKMAECEVFIQSAVKEAFETNFCNDVINILRIAGEKYEHAHGMAQKMLEDMNLMKVPYNDVTMALVQAVVFNDGPFDSSPLLFEIIEAPERGEVSLSHNSLESVSDEMLKLISNRHQTPLDDGVLLRSSDTHPLLQRSLD